MVKPLPSEGRAMHQRNARLNARKTAQKVAQSWVASFAFATFPVLLPQMAIAQTQAPNPQELAPQDPTSQPESAEPTAVPTVRYARGEEVDLSEIVAEWRGYYEDVPVYLCVCQEDTCDQTQQWPYREYSRYQLGVALGPTNGRIAEDSGANCFDIADNSRPSEPREFSAAQVGEETPASEETPADSPTDNAPQRPSPSSENDSNAVVAPVAPPATPPSAAPSAPVAPATSRVSTASVPTVTTINEGESIRLTWPSGTTNDIAIAGSTWNINVLDAVDCNSLTQVDSKTLSAQRVVGDVAVDSETGNIAIPVLLDSCVETDQSAVFILDPSEGGGYSLYRTQLPGSRSFPDEFSSYAFSSIVDVSYGKGLLYVQQGSASGAESVVIFRADRTPAGTYAGCTLVSNNEGANRLCPTNASSF